MPVHGPRREQPVRPALGLPTGSLPLLEVTGSVVRPSPQQPPGTDGGRWEKLDAQTRAESRLTAWLKPCETPGPQPFLLASGRASCADLWICCGLPLTHPGALQMLPTGGIPFARMSAGFLRRATRPRYAGRDLGFRETTTGFSLQVRWWTPQRDRVLRASQGPCPGASRRDLRGHPGTETAPLTSPHAVAVGCHLDPHGLKPRFQRSYLPAPLEPICTHGASGWGAASPTRMLLPSDTLVNETTGREQCGQSGRAGLC